MTRDTRQARFMWVSLRDLFSHRTSADGTQHRIGKGRVAICTETGRVALVSTDESIEFLFVQDTYITRKDADGPEVCEEAERCLDVDCALNRLSWEGFKRRTGTKMRKKPDGFGTRATWNRDDAAPDGLRSFRELVPADSPGGVMTWGKKERTDAQ